MDLHSPAAQGSRDAKEKEMVAYRLVDMVGRASAANILGITVRELDKLVDVFTLSEKFTSLRDPNSAITWARELMGVSKKSRDADGRRRGGEAGKPEEDHELEGPAGNCGLSFPIPLLGSSS